VGVVGGVVPVPAPPPPPPPQPLRDKQSSTQVRPCLIIRSYFSAAKNGRKG
jgi:hypothetical protein